MHRPPILPTLFAWLCLILLIVSASVYWYSIKIEFGPCTFKTHFSWFQECFDVTDSTTCNLLFGNNKCENWRDNCNNDCKNQENVFNASLAFIILALLLCFVGALVTTFGLHHHHRFPRFLALLCGIGTIVCTVIAIGAFTGLPNATKKDSDNSCNSGPCGSFSGSQDVPGGSQHWGPGPGWIIAVITLLFEILWTLFLLLGCCRGEYRTLA